MKGFQLRVGSLCKLSSTKLNLELGHSGLGMIERLENANSHKLGRKACMNGGELEQNIALNELWLNVVW